ncbi:melibiose:sodium transporter MelB [Fusobacterium sp.]|uniref:melibiose:sodium transporter MelB n=1 Tax=Fusobacterium sp. TaxID=68766 RepID=UPI00262B3E89|nr:melibiose:sodium transporter MelB [Fusobacterium sp.]
MDNVSKKISAKERYSFAIGALGKDLVYGITATFAMVYFTDVLGVGASFVGIVFFVARFWDAINDLMCGVIVDNTKNKFGKFRTWLVIGTISNAIVLALMFTDFGLSGASLYTYVAVSYVLWGMTYTLMDIPYWAMIPNFSRDKKEREKISVLPRIFASIANTLIIGGFGIQIIDFLGKGNTGLGYSRFAYTISAIFLVTIAITVANVKTPDEVARISTKQNDEKLDFKKMTQLIKENDQFLVTVGVSLNYNISISLIFAVAVYYFIYVCGSKGMFGVFMSFASLAEISGLFLFPKMATNFSKKKIYFYSAVTHILGFLVLLFTGIFCPQNPIMTALSGVLIKFGAGFMLGIITVTLADVVDYGEYKLKKRSETLIFSAQTLLVKFTGALGALLVGFVLDLTGYVPNTTQGPLTIFVLRFLMCIVPMIFITISYLLYKKKYILNHQYMEKIHASLK